MQEASATRSTPLDGLVQIDAVVTHHIDAFRSGVSRFNELLADHLDVPLLHISDPAHAERGCPLFSFKVSELSAAEAAELERALDARPGGWEVFLHEYSGLETEGRLIAGSHRVHCGSLEVYERARGLGRPTDVLWTPGLVIDTRPFEPTEISIFSFGMAHKIRTDMFRRLRDLLDASGRSYAIYVSAANHETASMRDAQIVFEEMHDVFPERLYFMGNLSDVAVFNYLRNTTFFAAFFGDGVRANNTSISSALEQGAITITNLDRYSPPEFRHMDNVIDLNQCSELPSDPLVLKRMSLRAMETGRNRSWAELARRLRETQSALPNR